MQCAQPDLQEESEPILDAVAFVLKNRRWAVGQPAMCWPIVLVVGWLVEITE